MITFQLNEKEYKIPTEHKEITLEFYFGIYQIVDKYSGIIIGDEVKEPSESDIMKMYGEIFQYMTGIDDDTLKKTPIESIVVLIDNIDGLLKEYPAKGNVDRFKIDGIEYIFPYDHMRGSTFGEYIESSQLEANEKLMKNGRFDVLPEQMAILCRPAGEDFDDKLTEERTKLFKKNVTMDTVFEFAFFLQKRLDILTTAIPTFLAQGQKTSELQNPKK